MNHFIYLLRSSRTNLQKRKLAFIASLLLVSCGKHDIQSKSSLFTGPVNEGIKASDEIGKIQEYIEQGEIKAVENSIKDGTDANSQLKNGYTILGYATYLVNIPLVYKLLSIGADPTVKDLSGRTPLVIATTQASERLMLLFDSSRTHEEQLELEKWITKRRAGKVLQILEKGVDPNFHFSTGETPLTLAIQTKASLIVQNLVEFQDPAGAIRTDVNFPNKNGASPLQIAETIRSENSEIYDFLLSHGAIKQPN